MFHLKEKPLENWGNKTPRQLAQWLGTDVYRNQFDEEVWLKNMYFRIKEYINNPNVLVLITDCRFNNEAEFVKNLNGIIIKVDASERLTNEDSHVSEIGIDGNFIDKYIDNNGSYSELDIQVRDFIIENF